MGEVYRARDTRLGRDVALKILPEPFMHDAERLARFEREARVLASLNHPYIAAIYGIEESDGLRALVLELVEGATLAERIAEGPIPPAEALGIADQIADALDAAHGKGIVHRDLKPANVKLSPEGVVKVLDFGLAKGMDPSDASDAAHSPTVTAVHTRDGVLLGTAAYMSPEQVRGRAVDKRADIWAFGCVLYEMLTARRAFPGATISDTIAAILEREPDWTALPAAVPPHIRRLLRRCLEKDTKRRLRDIGDFRTEAEESVPAVAERPAAPRRRLAWYAIAVIAALAAAALIWQQRLGRNGDVSNPLAHASFERLTSFEESERDAAISADGRFAVFVSNHDGPYDVWVTQLGTGASTNLTKGELPYLLNDGIRNVGFTSNNEVTLVFEPRDATGGATRTETIVLPLTGGPMRRLLDRGVEAVWSADGSRMAYHESSAGDPIFVADAAGRDAHRIFAGTPGTHAHYLTWSPDGRFIYFVGGVPPDEMDIWRVPAAGGPAERLTTHNADVAYPAFVDNRTLIYRARAETGSEPSLYAIDVDRPRPIRASLGVEQYLSVSASADGRRLVATVANPSSGLWTIPITNGIVTEESAAPVIVPNVRALFPRFSRNATWYLSSDGGATGVWRLNREGAREAWHSRPDDQPGAPAPSPDGRLVSFVSRRDGRGRLSVMDQDGTNVRTLASDLDVRDAPAWSPDGQWIAVATGDRLLKVPVDGGSPTLLIEGSARLPVWSPDGRFIAYSESIQGGPAYPVKAVTPEGKPFALPTFSARRSGDRYRIMPDGRQVVFVIGDYGRQDFWLIDLETGARRQLTNLRRGMSIQGFDIAADGSRILFDRVRENSDIVLIELPSRF
jgi:Tol biopolymer transport system component